VTTRPDGPGADGLARAEAHPTPRVAHGGLPGLVAALGAALLTTVALVLWYPIDMAAIERADDAGWDTTLLHPHQFLLSAVLLGACLYSWVTAFVTVRAFRSPEPS